ncbi:MAG: hypothetical protein AAGD35_21790 [Actinomycetota bacterium]
MSPPVPPPRFAPADLPALAERVGRMLDDAWHAPGFCVPNPDTYPHQWLWDSCFHAIVWDALGDGRGLTELATTMASMDASGFVPHMTYWHGPSLHADFWGRPTTSIITQPAMYGHAARRLHEPHGRSIDPELSERIARALGYLLFDRVRTDGNLVAVLHPWETGCDDSPRWDDHRHRGEEWSTTKGDLVAVLRERFDGDDAGRIGAGGSGGLPFVVGSIGFNALLVWNTREYLATDGAVGHDRLGPAADGVAAAVAARWDPARCTWVDDAPRVEGSVGSAAASASARTADTMLGLLVDPRPEALAQLHRSTGFGAPFGPRGVHNDEPGYAPDLYWRGPAWPQLCYLLWQAALAMADDEAARALARSLVAGARGSGFAEYWHPDTGQGLGAIPQTWAGLALPAAQWMVAQASG